MKNTRYGDGKDRKRIRRGDDGEWQWGLVGKKWPKGVE